MNVKKYLFIFCLLTTSNLFGIFKAESPDTTKLAYFDDETKYLMIKSNGSEEPIKIFNFNYNNILLKQILWTKNNKYLIVNIEITQNDGFSKYNIIERIEIKKNKSYVKEITPSREEQPQIELIETIEIQDKQVIKIKIKKQDGDDFNLGWLNVKTGVFIYAQED